jgi:hypothetical protein
MGAESASAPELELWVESGVESGVESDVESGVESAWEFERTTGAASLSAPSPECDRAVAGSVPVVALPHAASSTTTTIASMASAGR